MRRLDAGGDAIDRSRVVSFTFDGRELKGSPATRSASALLANGVGVRLSGRRSWAGRAA